MSENTTTPEPPDDYSLVSHLEMCTQMQVTSTDAETSQTWGRRRDKARAILLARLAANAVAPAPERAR